MTFEPMKLSDPQPRNVGNVKPVRDDVFAMSIYKDGKLWYECFGKVWITWDKTFSVTWTNSGNIICETTFFIDSYQVASGNRWNTLRYRIKPFPYALTREAEKKAEGAEKKVEIGT